MKTARQTIPSANLSGAARAVFNLPDFFGELFGISLKIANQLSDRRAKRGRVDAAVQYDGLCDLIVEFNGPRLAVRPYYIVR